MTTYYFSSLIKNGFVNLLLPIFWSTFKPPPWFDFGAVQFLTHAVIMIHMVASGFSNTFKKHNYICKHVGQLLTGRNVCLMSDSEYLLDRCVSLDLLENKRIPYFFFEKYNVSNQPFVSKFFGHIQSLNSPFSYKMIVWKSNC